MIFKTLATKKKDIIHGWHIVDVKDAILGRVATKVAALLSGKSKPYFVRHLDCGEHVVVINAKYVKVTGKKEKNKVYTTYSGYPGGIKKTTLEELRKNKPEEIIRHSIYGMLPDNKLRQQFMKRLYIFGDSNHSFKEKFIDAHKSS